MSHDNKKQRETEDRNMTAIVSAVVLGILAILRAVFPEASWIPGGEIALNIVYTVGGIFGIAWLSGKQTAKRAERKAGEHRRITGRRG